MATIEAATRPLGALKDEHERLVDRLGALYEGAAELADVLAAADRRERAAYDEAGVIARAAGGTEITYGSTSVGGDRPPGGWSFRWPFAAPPELEPAWERFQAIRAEVQPVRDAFATIDGAIDACRAALDQVEARIAAAEAQREQDRAERLTRWTGATTERHLPPWQDRAESILSRLELDG